MNRSRSYNTHIYNTYITLITHVYNRMLLSHRRKWNNSICSNKEATRDYHCQEAMVRTGHGTMDWFQIGKGVCQVCILPPCLFNFYAEYIMRNAWLDEAQSGIKIAGRNINNLRYADDTTLMAESEEELKSLLMKVREESEKTGLKLNIQKMKIMASSSIISWQIDGETMETVTDFIFLGSKVTADGDWSLEIWRNLMLEKTLGSLMDSKEIKPGLMLRLKRQYFGQLMWRTDPLEKTLKLGKIEGRRRRGRQKMRCWDGIAS